MRSRARPPHTGNARDVADSHYHLPLSVYRSPLTIPYLPAVARVNLIASVGKNEVHVVRLGARAFHARRSSWHACYREAARFRALLEQPLDVLGRHVALDCVALHNGGVAAAQLIGDAVLRPIRVGVAYVCRLRTEAVCPQMFDPRAAAASGRALVNGDLRSGRILRRTSWQQQRCSHNGRPQKSSHKLTPSMKQAVK